MGTIDYYINSGISRVILGSAALFDKEFAKAAAKKHGDKIAVGIDAKNRKVQTSGWLVDSEVDFTELAAEMAKIGVKNIIYTDISKDGTLAGANLEHYKELQAILPPDVDITASGGIVGLEDIKNLRKLGLYGAICGKAIYSGSLDLAEAIKYAKMEMPELSKLFEKHELIPAIIQDHENGEVLMLGWMNEQSLKLTLETKRTWFYSRSRQKLWNKGETSGNFTNVKGIFYDCEQNSLLIKAEQIGVICHTGNKSCFYRELI